MSWEVWTMKSKMSFFNPTLLKKNISRFAPAWGIFVVLLLLVYPMGALRGVDRYEETERYLMDMTAAGPFFAFFSALLFVPILFKYLHKSRAAYMIHAFPLTRTCLFVTNLVSGLAFFLVWLVHMARQSVYVCARPETERSAWLLPVLLLALVVGNLLEPFLLARGYFVGHMFFLTAGFVSGTYRSLREKTAP